jgi:AcrR family transcriptional regulator
MRERIVRATMSLHDEKGVAATSYPEIAARAGVGAASVYRHFPTPGELVMACGVHVWGEMRPPTADEAVGKFAGLEVMEERVRMLVETLDAFYTRGSLRLGLAAKDRDAIPELDRFWRGVEVGVQAFVREALRPAKPSRAKLETAIALLDFPTWTAFSRRAMSERSRKSALERLVAAAIA